MSAAVELALPTAPPAGIAAPAVTSRPSKRRRTSTVLPSPEESPSSPIEKTADLSEISLSEEEETKPRVGSTTASDAADELLTTPFATPATSAADALSTYGDPAALLRRATHVLRTEAAALAAVTALYTTSAPHRAALARATATVLRSQRRGGKLVVCGVGKSGYIGQKLVATCKSLGVAASFLHACEAAHGDLGDVRADRGDCLAFVTFSGRTPELLNVVAHLPRDVDVLALTGRESVKDCAVLAARVDEEDEAAAAAADLPPFGAALLLPTPIVEPEEVSFGVCAPTTSTTVALAVADMLALTVAEALHAGATKAVFAKNHPGGAIGVQHRREEKELKSQLAKTAAAATTKTTATVSMKTGTRRIGDKKRKLRGDEDNESTTSVVELPSPSISGESDD